MVSIQVKLHDNTAYTIDMESYDSVEMTQTLNNNQLTVVNIGGLIVARNSVKVVVPVQPVQP